MKSNYITSIIIPTYNPKRILYKIIDSIIYNHNSNDNLKNFKLSILVVNDGSDDRESLNIFDALKDFQCVKLLNNIKNIGQGGSVKEGIKYFKKIKNNNNIITCDDDGQHDVKDIINIILFRLNKNDLLVIGQRNFKKNVPFKSFFGNRICAYLTNLLFSIKIDDTQSGLRKYNVSYLNQLLLIEKNGFDFNILALLKAFTLNNNIRTIPMETIYLENNKLTNFNVIKDSIKVIKAIISFKIF